MRVNRALPLVTRHIKGHRNALGDIPSRSFGYKPEWQFEHDSELLKFFDATFPLPNQNSWQGFRLSDAVCSRVMRKLATAGL